MTSVLALFALLRLQSYLPLSEGHQNVSPALAFNTAVSFTTNTSWENYAGEATLGHLAVAAGLGVAAFTAPPSAWRPASPWCASWPATRPTGWVTSGST